VLTISHTSSSGRYRFPQAAHFHLATVVCFRSLADMANSQGFDVRRTEDKRSWDQCLVAVGSHGMKKMCVIS